jgi:hypothetical protein
MVSFIIELYTTVNYFICFSYTRCIKLDRMPNKRAENQTMIAFACDREMLRALDDARKAQEGRSSFVRQAIIAELKRRKIQVNPKWAFSPDRAKASRYPPRR